METYEDLVEYLDNRKTENYKGYEIKKGDIYGKKNNKKGSSIYSQKNSINDLYGDELRDPNEDEINDEKFGVIDYILDVGFKKEDLEGGSGKSHLRYHNEVFERFYKKNGRYPDKIAEIGFNSGISSWYFLNKMIKYNKECKMVSFDLGIHEYCFYAKYFIDKIFPDNHILINGNSLYSVKNFTKISDMKFDIIFIDGDHTFFGAYNDIINCKEISNKNTLVILDNVVPHRGVGREVYLAMKKLLYKDFIFYLEHREIDIKQEEYHDGCSLIKYNFTDKEVPKNINFNVIERKVLTYSIMKIIKSENLTKSIFQDIYSIVKDHRDEISDWTINKFNKELYYLNKEFKLRYKPIK